MPRIRTIKPDFWDSADTGAASLRTRLLYIAMWNWADDYGIGDGHPGRIITFAFPNDDIAAADYPRLLADVSDAFGVVFFEHEGRPFYTVPAWDKHQRTEKKAKPREGLVEAAQSAAEKAVAARQTPNADSPRNVADSPTQNGEHSDAGSRKSEGEIGKGTGEDEPPLPDEPPDDPYIDAVVVPEFIESSTRKPKQYPSQSAKAVVRQELGNAGYPNTILDRLAVQVEKLYREQHPDALIREALAEWDRKPDAIPEWLPTVLGDVVKKSRAVDTNVTAFDRKKAHNGHIFQALADPTQNPELLA